VGVVYKVGVIIQVWMGGVGRSQGLGPLRHLSDGGGVRGPTQRGTSQDGDPAGLELGAGWVEVALARCQTMGWSQLDDTA
jgi:hypothetical protein